MFRLTILLLVLMMLLVGCSSEKTFSEEARTAFTAQLAEMGVTDFEIVSAVWVDNPVEMQADFFCVEINTTTAEGYNGFRVVDDAPEYQITHRHVIGDPSLTSPSGTNGTNSCFNDD